MILVFAPIQNVQRTVKSISVAGVEVGQFVEGQKKNAVGLRLVVIATVSEEDGMPGNITSSCKVQWLEPQGIAQIIGSEPSVLHPARDIYRWRGELSMHKPINRYVHMYICRYVCLLFYFRREICNNITNCNIVNEQAIIYITWL